MGKQLHHGEYIQNLFVLDILYISIIILIQVHNVMIVHENIAARCITPANSNNGGYM